MSEREKLIARLRSEAVNFGGSTGELFDEAATALAASGGDRDDLTLIEAEAAGYRQGREDSERAEIPALLNERDILRVDLAMCKAIRSFLERGLAECQARSADLEAQLRARPAPEGAEPVAGTGGAENIGTYSYQHAPIASATGVHASPRPWKYKHVADGEWPRDWIEDANGEYVVEGVGHIDGPLIVASVNCCAEAAPAHPPAPADARITEAREVILKQLGALIGLVGSLNAQDDEGLIEHAQQMVDARSAIASARTFLASGKAQ